MVKILQVFLFHLLFLNHSFHFFSKRIIAYLSQNFCLSKEDIDSFAIYHISLNVYYFSLTSHKEIISLFKCKECDLFLKKKSVRRTKTAGRRLTGKSSERLQKLTFVTAVVQVGILPLSLSCGSHPGNCLLLGGSPPQNAFNRHQLNKVRVQKAAKRRSLNDHIFKFEIKPQVDTKPPSWEQSACLVRSQHT